MTSLLVGVVIGMAITGVAWWRQHRRVSRSIQTVVGRLSERPVRSPDVDRLVDELYRTADRWRVESASEIESSRRWLAVLDRIVLPIVVVGPDGADLLRNEAARAEDGRSHTGPLVRTAIDEAVAEAMESGDRNEQTLRLTGPPRRTLRIEAWPLVGPDEKMLGAAACLTDHSALERVDDMRRDFVANLSHELKTPVGAIALLAETLRDETEPDVRDRLLRKAESEAHRLAAIIDDLLELAELEAMSVTPDQPVAVDDAVAEAVDQVAGSPHGAGRTVGTDDLLPVKVIGDHRLIVSALANLIDNALKYSDPSTEVRVHACVVEPGTVDVNVTDHGIGIPQTHLDRIFERFYRVDRGRSRVTGGTGLGLSIVRHTVERMGGEVFVESREGQGSTFTLRLQSVVDDR